MTDVIRISAVAAMLALTVATTAEAAVQTCSVASAGGARATLRIEERGRSIAALGMDFTQPVGRSAHECSIGARRGDRYSRWRGDGAATYVTITDPAAGPFEAAVQRYRGELQLGISATGGDLASCGTIMVPGTVIVIPKANGAVSRGCRDDDSRINLKRVVADRGGTSSDAPACAL